MSLFSIHGDVKRYGPLKIQDHDCTINKAQQMFIEAKYGLWPVIRYRPSWGIWVGSTSVHETMPACLG